MSQSSLSSLSSPVSYAPSPSSSSPPSPLLPPTLPTATTLAIPALLPQKRKRTNYTEQQKFIALYHCHKHDSVAKTAEDFGIQRGVIYQWKRLNPELYFVGTNPFDQHLDLETREYWKCMSDSVDSRELKEMALMSDDFRHHSPRGGVEGKCHSLSYYGETIRLAGTPDNYNTEHTEHQHIIHAKTPYRKTNKRQDCFLQMLRYVDACNEGRWSEICHYRRMQYRQEHNIKMELLRKEQR